MKIRHILYFLAAYAAMYIVAVGVLYQSDKEDNARQAAQHGVIK